MALLLKAVDPTASPPGTTTTLDDDESATCTATALALASRGVVCLADEVRMMRSLGRLGLDVDAVPACPSARMSAFVRGGSSSELRTPSPLFVFDNNRQRCHSDSAVVAASKRRTGQEHATEEETYSAGRQATIEERGGGAQHPYESEMCSELGEPDDDGSDDDCAALDKLDLPPSRTETTEEMTHDPDEHHCCGQEEGAASAAAAAAASPAAARHPRPPTDSPMLRLRDERCLGAVESFRDDDDDDDEGIVEDESDIESDDGDDDFVPPSRSVLSVSQFSAFASGGEYIFDSSQDDDDDDVGGAHAEETNSDSFASSEEGLVVVEEKDAVAAAPVDEDAESSRAADEEDESVGAPPPPPPPPRRRPNRRRRHQRRGGRPASFSGTSLEDLDLPEVLPVGRRGDDDDDDGVDGASAADDDNNAVRSSSLSAMTAQSSHFSSGQVIEDELDLTKISERAADDDDDDLCDDDDDESSHPSPVVPCAPSPASSRASCLIKRPISEPCSGASGGSSATDEPPADDYSPSDDDCAEVGAESVFRRRSKPIPRPRGLHSRCSTMPAAPYTEGIDVAASVSFEEKEERTDVTPASMSAPESSAPQVVQEEEDGSFVDSSSSSGPEPYHLRRLRRADGKPAALKRHARSNTLPTIVSPGAVAVAAHHPAVAPPPGHNGEVVAGGDDPTAHLITAHSTMGAVLHRSKLSRSESAASRRSQQQHRVVVRRVIGRPGRLSAGHHRHQSLPASAIADLGGGVGGMAVLPPHGRARDDSFLTANERGSVVAGMGRPAGLRRSSTVASRHRAPALVARRPSSLTGHRRNKSLPATMIADLGALVPPSASAGAPVGGGTPREEDAFLENERGVPRAGLLRRSSSIASRRSQHRRTKTLPSAIVNELSSVLAVTDGATPSASNGSLLSGPGGGQRSASNSGRNVVLVDGNARPGSILRRQRSERTDGGGGAAAGSAAAASTRPAPLRHRQRSNSASPRLSSRSSSHAHPRLLPRHEEKLARAAHAQGQHRQHPQTQQQQQQHPKKAHIRRMSPHAPFREILEGAGYGESAELAVEAHRRQLLASCAASSEDQPQGGIIRGKLLRRKGGHAPGHRRIQSLPSGACYYSSASSIHSSASRGSRPPLPPSAPADDGGGASPTAAEMAAAAATGIPSVFSDDGVRYGSPRHLCSPRNMAGGGSSPRQQQGRRSPYPELLADRPRRRRTSSLSDASHLTWSASSMPSPPSCHHRRILSADSTATANSAATVRTTASGGSGVAGGGSTKENEEEGGDASVADDEAEGGDDEEGGAGNEEEEVDNCCRDHFEREARKGNLGGVRPALRSVRKSVGRAVLPESVRAQFRNKGVELKRAKGRLV